MILKSLMKKRGYRTTKVERTQTYKRIITFKKGRGLDAKIVKIKIDERELEDFKSVHELECYYEDKINEVLN